MTQTRCCPNGYISRRRAGGQAFPEAVCRKAQAAARSAHTLIRQIPEDEAGYAPRFLCKTRMGRVMTAIGTLGALSAAQNLWSSPLAGVALLVCVGVAAIGLRR